MKVILSCCDRKNGTPFFHEGKEITFISHVKKNLPDGLHVHPDDSILNNSITWRSIINEQGSRDDLIPAYELYKPDVYKLLFERYHDDLFIFSAGWGIVKASFKLPKYNITFSKNKNIPIHARRNHEDFFNDFNQLVGIDENERIILIAGSDYVLPFCHLTKGLPNKKTIIYKSQNLLNNNPYLNDHNYEFIHYQTNTRTNWHYEFAKRLINNEFLI